MRFQPPRLHLGDHIDLAIGPKSSVVLTTTYLTPEVRIGKGSRGSLFVFTKGGEAATAGKYLLDLMMGTATYLSSVEEAERESTMFSSRQFWTDLHSSVFFCFIGLKLKGYSLQGGAHQLEACSIKL